MRLGRRLLALCAAAALCGSSLGASCASARRNTDVRRRPRGCRSVVPVLNPSPAALQLLMCSSFVEYPLAEAAWSAERGIDPPIHPESVDGRLEDAVDLVARPAVKRRFSVASQTCAGAIKAHFCYSAFPLCYEEDGGLPHPYCDSAALGDLSWPSGAPLACCPPPCTSQTAPGRLHRGGLCRLPAARGGGRASAGMHALAMGPALHHCDGLPHPGRGQSLRHACMRHPGARGAPCSACITAGGCAPSLAAARPYSGPRQIHNVTGLVVHGKDTPWRWRWRAPSCYSMTFNFTSNPGIVRYYLGPDGNGTDAEPVARATRWEGPCAALWSPEGLCFSALTPRDSASADRSPDPEDDGHPKYVPYSPPDDGGTHVRRLGTSASVGLVVGVLALVVGVMVAIVPSARSSVYRAFCGGVQTATQRRRGFDRVPMEEGPLSRGEGTPGAVSEGAGTEQADWVDDGRHAEPELRAATRPAAAEASGTYGAGTGADYEAGQVEVL